MDVWWEVNAACVVDACLTSMRALLFYWSVLRLGWARGPLSSGFPVATTPPSDSNRYLPSSSSAQAQRWNGRHRIDCLFRQAGQPHARRERFLRVLGRGSELHDSEGAIQRWLLHSHRVLDRVAFQPSVNVLGRHKHDRHGLFMDALADAVWLGGQDREQRVNA